MTDKQTPTTDLLKRCAEIHEWRSTGVLSGEALRDYAKRKWPGRLDTLQMAEHETVTEALALLAKLGQPAQAAPECLTCSDHGAVGNILTAEPCPDCTHLNAQPAPATQPAGGCPPLPNLDSSDEPIWEAIFNWKTATPGADAARKANKVENAIIETMRACVDADRAARAPEDSVQEDAARYRFLRDGEWRDTDLEPFIRLQLNTLWDAKIDDARKQGEKQ